MRWWVGRAVRGSARVKHTGSMTDSWLSVMKAAVARPPMLVTNGSRQLANHKPTHWQGADLTRGPGPAAGASGGLTNHV